MVILELRNTINEIKYSVNGHTEWKGRKKYK